MELQGDIDLTSIREALDDVTRTKWEEKKNSKLAYDLWFARTKIVYLDSDRAVFVCENKSKRDIIEKKYLPFLGECLEFVIGYMPEELSIEVDESLAPEVPDDGTVISPLKIVRERQAAREAESKKTADESKTDKYAGSTVSSGLFNKSDEENAPGKNSEFSSPSQPSEIPEGITREEYDKQQKEEYLTMVEQMTSANSKLTNSLNEMIGNAPKPQTRVFKEDYTFENFIVGNSNRFAHAAALNVADNVGAKNNPLFLHGPSGLGKTHLMYAIANRVLARDPSKNIICKKGEEFMNEVIESIRSDRNTSFRQKYRNCDMLLIDDIQFIAGTQSTQTEFFHTFEALYEDHKQIIITSDRPPKDLETLEQRITSRFEAGLLADIQPPDYELRLAILKNKISQSNIEVPVDVMDFLAQNLQENIRQLEGVVKKLAMSNLLTGQPVSMDMVIQTVPEYLREEEPVSDMIDRVVNCVAKRFSVSPEEIMSSSRKKDIKDARNISMYVVRAVSDISLSQIGNAFGRDHSTVHSNIGGIESEIGSDPVLAATVKEIIKEVKRG